MVSERQKVLGVELNLGDIDAVHDALSAHLQGLPSGERRVGVQLDLLDSERLNDFFERRNFNQTFSKFGAQILAGKPFFKELEGRIRAMGAKPVVVDSPGAVEKVRTGLEQKMDAEIDAIKNRQGRYDAQDKELFYDLLYKALGWRDRLAFNFSADRDAALLRRAYEFGAVVLGASHAKWYAKRAGVRPKIINLYQGRELEEFNAVRRLAYHLELQSPAAERLLDYEPPSRFELAIRREISGLWQWANRKLWD